IAPGVPSLDRPARRRSLDPAARRAALLLHRRGGRAVHRALAALGRRSRAGVARPRGRAGARRAHDHPRPAPRAGEPAAWDGQALDARTIPLDEHAARASVRQGRFPVRLSTRAWQALTERAHERAGGLEVVIDGSAVAIVTPTSGAGA